MPDLPTHPAIAFAQLIHETGRQPVAEGKTLAHATEPAKTRPFVEWDALPDHVVVGRTMTALCMLERYNVRPRIVDDATQDEIAAVARALHESERAAIEGGFVLVALKRPWLTFDEIPEVARAGRLRQAATMLRHCRLLPRRASDASGLAQAVGPLAGLPFEQAREHVALIYPEQPPPMVDAIVAARRLVDLAAEPK